jgi:beta-phosphoglucomutase-like phosphatase (HAD superfamily)
VKSARIPFQGIIFDVDGVLLVSPHEQAWRQSLRQLMRSHVEPFGMQHRNGAHRVQVVVEPK